MVMIVVTIAIAVGIRGLVLAKDRDIVAVTLQKSDDSGKELGNIKTDDKRSVLTRLIALMAFWVVLILGVFVTMQVVGLHTTGVVAIITAFGLTIGLAMQGVLGDFLSGVLIATFAIYRIGDTIQVKDVIGIVVDFRLLHTVVRDFHTYAYITIPNNTIYNNVTTNLSLATNKWMHVNVKLTNRGDIGELTDVSFVRRIIINDLLNPTKKENYPDVDFTRIKPDILRKYKENGAGGVQVVVFDMTSFGTDVRIVYPVVKPSTFYAQMRLNTRVRQILSDHNVGLAFQG
jgi:small-conductance mechanosensitive channel